MRPLLLCSVALAITATIVNATGFGAAANAQATNPAPPGPAKMLYIDVLEGEGELNDIRARTAREPVVQVKDENHKPVAGALVLFSIRSGGAQPAAAFSGLPTLSVRTGADGIARAQGYSARHAGSVQVQPHLASSPRKPSSTKPTTLLAGDFNGLCLPTRPWQAP